VRSAGALAGCLALVEALREKRVAFCAWKSNEHLAAALAGETDLDLLVDRADAPAFREVAGRLAVKALIPPADGRHPATEHYLGLDEATGRLFHVHVQYRLVLGERYAKNYILPLEQELLDGVTVLDGMPIPPADIELAILATRALLKYRFRDIVKDALRIRSPGVPIETRAEIAWLERRTTRAQLRARLESGDGVLPVGPICCFLETIESGRRSGVRLLRIRSQLRRALRPYRRRGYLRARVAYARGAWLRRRRLRRAAPDLRMMPVEGGASLALVGPDGSGKSTMANAIDSWLGWKLQTRVHYMGSKEPSSRSRALYMLFRALRRTHRASLARFEGRSRLTEPIASARDTVRALHSLSIGGDRARRYRKGVRDARSGRVVIFDRFPLDRLSPSADIRVFDGPQIASVLPGPMARVPRTLAAAEARLYGQFRLPEHVVLLCVDPDVAIARKPDHLREVLAAKCDALAVISELAEKVAGVQFARIDANRPSDQVLSDIKRVVWDVI
jgi:thymidylate kinase